MNIDIGEFFNKLSNIVGGGSEGGVGKVVDTII